MSYLVYEIKKGALKMSSFMQYTKKYSCVKHREVDEIQEKSGIVNTNKDATRWNDNNVLKDALVEYLKGNLKLGAIPTAVENSIVGTYDIEEQEQLKIKAITDLAIRACLSEKWRKALATFPEKNTITYKDEVVDVWCDVAFVDLNRKYVDCVLYVAGVPKFTKTGKKKIEDYIPIYWLERFARLIAEDYFDPGTKVITEAHIVYLKKTSEPKGISIRYSYLDEKNHLGIVNDNFVIPDNKVDDDNTDENAGKDENLISPIDKKFNDLLDNFAAGTEECSPEDCKNCANNMLCHFALPPEPAPKKELKVRKKIIPSEAQQVIIDWAESLALS